MDIDVQKAKFDLNLDVTEDQGRIRGRLIYSSDLFTPSTIMRMLEHFDRLLRDIVAQPDACLSDLEMLLDEERTLLARSSAIEDFEMGFSI
jgi:non-ribosomal peptide synthetase component F